MWITIYNHHFSTQQFSLFQMHARVRSFYHSRMKFCPWCELCTVQQAQQLIWDSYTYITSVPLRRYYFSMLASTCTCSIRHVLLAVVADSSDYSFHSNEELFRLAICSFTHLYLLIQPKLWHSVIRSLTSHLSATFATSSRFDESTARRSWLNWLLLR